MDVSRKLLGLVSMMTLLLFTVASLQVPAFADTTLVVVTRSTVQPVTVHADGVACLTADDQTAIRANVAARAMADAQAAYWQQLGHAPDPNISLRPELYADSARHAWYPQAVQMYRTYLIDVGRRYVLARGPQCTQAVMAFLRGSGVVLLDERQLLAELELGGDGDVNSSGNESVGFENSPDGNNGSPACCFSASDWNAIGLAAYSGAAFTAALATLGINTNNLSNNPTYEAVLAALGYAAVGVQQFIATVEEMAMNGGNGSSGGSGDGGSNSNH